MQVPSILPTTDWGRGNIRSFRSPGVCTRRGWATAATEKPPGVCNCPEETRQGRGTSRVKSHCPNSSPLCWGLTDRCSVGSFPKTPENKTMFPGRWGILNHLWLSRNEFLKHMLIWSFPPWNQKLSNIIILSHSLIFFFSWLKSKRHRSPHGEQWDILAVVRTNAPPSGVQLLCPLSQALGFSPSALPLMAVVTRRQRWVYVANISH